MPNSARQNDENRLTKERPRREIRGFNPKGEIEDKDKKEKVKHISTRKFYGEYEHVYIMDAKSIGNIGRYLNHSCNPNVFVQNCFVDTHDLRFPWVAFFASVHIQPDRSFVGIINTLLIRSRGRKSIVNVVVKIAEEGYFKLTQISISSRSIDS